MKTIFQALLTFLILLSAPAFAFYGYDFGIDPWLEWRTMETPRFRVTYPKELEDVAKRSAKLLEEAQTLLGPRLLWEPRNKIQVTIVDSSDAANGLTSPALRVGIVLYPTPPDAWFPTSYTDDWLRLLIFHEYTHLLNMDPTEDWSEVLRWIYGDAIRPNGLWYSWMLEGLAVYMETKLTGVGRGTSPYFEAILRAAVQEGKLKDSNWFDFNRLVGTDPYFPGGEVPYFFGYQLMSQVARDPELKKRDRTSDGRDALKEPESAFGIMSLRSASRLPFLVSGNLKNVTGKEWDQYWDRFIAETETRMTKELKTLKSRPLTEVKKLAENGMSPIGSAVSQDGNLLAYSIETPDEEEGLYVKDLKTGKTKRLRDKVLGAGMAFVPDGSKIIASELRRTGNYKLYSDLIEIDASSGSHHFLTKGERLKDPDVSRDGSKITFTKAEHAGVVLQIAKTEDLKKPRTIYRGKTYDSVSSPKFSRDGKRIYFTLQRAGERGMDLMVWEEASGTARTLLTDGNFNRFPVVDGNGTLYFVSDRTGIDNLYRFRTEGRAELVTNFTSALWLPIFSGQSSQFYGSVLQANGWSLSSFQAETSPLPAESLKVGPAPKLPPLDSDEKLKAVRSAENTPLEDHSYSVFPSILPRAWAPYLASDSNGVQVGGQVLGFDALDFHRYSLLGTYDTELKLFDGILDYQYRGFGPLLSFRAAHYTSSTSHFSNGEVFGFKRRLLGQASIAFPILFTRSSLTPSISGQIEREKTYIPLIDSDHPTRSYRFLPSVSGNLAFRDTSRSRLAINSEEGRSARTGVRRYLDGKTSVMKYHFSWTEFFELFHQAVLIPSIAGSLSNRSHPIEEGNVLVKGRQWRLLKTSLGPGDSSLDEILVRGYGDMGTFPTRRAALGSLDLQVPIFRFFRGFGTWPIFLENLYITGYGEATRAKPIEGSYEWLPSAGGGIRLSTEMLTYLPLTFTVEVEHGFRKERQGDTEVIGTILVPSVSF